MNNMVKENIDSIFENLERFLKTETVVGQPITVGEATIIPMISVSFGAGTGAGDGNDGKGNGGNGGGGGVAAKVSPTAVLVIKNGEVNVISLKGKNNLESLVAMVPDIVEKIKLKKDDKEEEIDEEE